MTGAELAGKRIQRSDLLKRHTSLCFIPSLHNASSSSGCQLRNKRVPYSNGLSLDRRLIFTYLTHNLHWVYLAFRQLVNVRELTYLLPARLPCSLLLQTQPSPTPLYLTLYSGFFALPHPYAVTLVWLSHLANRNPLFYSVRAPSPRFFRQL